MIITTQKVRDFPSIRFLYDKSTNRYTCYNRYAEYSGDIYPVNGKWAFYSAFTGEVWTFDTAAQAQDFFTRMEKEENGE